MDSINSQLVFEISVPPLVVHSNPISETLDRGLGLLQKNKVLDQVVTALRPHSHSHPQQYHGSVCLGSDALLVTWFEEDVERSHSEVYEYCNIYGARLINNAHLPEAQIFASTGTFEHQRNSNSKLSNGSSNNTTQSSAKKSKPNAVYEYHSPIFDINANSSYVPPTFTSPSPPTTPQTEHGIEQQPTLALAPTDSTSVGVSLYTFAEPPQNRRTRNSSHRLRQVKTLYFSGAELEVNKLQAYRFCHELRRRTALFNAAESLANWPAYYPEQRFTRPVLFLLNPRGGSGRALEIFKNVINPALYEAGIEYSLFITARAGHACEFVRSVDLSHFYGLCVVSGDGLIHEVVNGLMWRPDWAEAIRKPMGFLPAGSGNALIASLLYSVGERFEPGTLLAHALYMFLKHVPFPHDLARIECQCASAGCSSSSAGTIAASPTAAAPSGAQSIAGSSAPGGAAYTSDAVPFSTAVAFAAQGPGQAQAQGPVPAAAAPFATRTLWSHLAFSWAFIAEVDIESEILRFIGGARFKVYSIPKILQLRAYRGRMTFLPAHPYTGRCSATSEFTNDLQSLYVARDSELLPPSTDPHLQPQPNSNANGDGENGGDGLSRFAPRPPRDWPRLHFVPPLHEPIALRGGWTVIEDDFVALSVAYCSHLSSDTIVAPDKRIGHGDALMYLVMVRAGVSRLGLVRLLLHSFGAAADGSARQPSGSGSGSDKPQGRSYSGSDGVTQRAHSKSPGRGGGNTRTTSDPTDDVHRVDRLANGPPSSNQTLDGDAAGDTNEQAFFPADAGTGSNSQGFVSALEVIPIRAFRFEPFATCPRASSDSSANAGGADGRRSKTIVGCEENARVARDREHSGAGVGGRLPPSKSASEFITCAPTNGEEDAAAIRARVDSSVGLTDGHDAGSSYGACRHQSIDAGVSRVLDERPPPPCSSSGAEQMAASPEASTPECLLIPNPEAPISGSGEAQSTSGGGVAIAIAPRSGSVSSGAKARSGSGTPAPSSPVPHVHQHPPGGMILTVDGERIEYGAVQGELIPSLAVFMGLPLPPTATANARGSATATSGAADCN